MRQEHGLESQSLNELTVLGLHGLFFIVWKRLDVRLPSRTPFDMPFPYSLQERPWLTVISSDPGKLEPLQGKEFAFIVEDPDKGTYQITFLKDDNGKYTKCRIVNENMIMDVVGKKI